MFWSTGSALYYIVHGWIYICCVQIDFNFNNQTTFWFIWVVLISILQEQQYDSFYLMMTSVKTFVLILLNQIVLTIDFQRKEQCYLVSSTQDDVMKQKHFARYCLFVGGIHRWRVLLVDCMIPRMILMYFCHAGSRFNMNTAFSGIRISIKDRDGCETVLSLLWGVLYW